MKYIITSVKDQLTGYMNITAVQSKEIAMRDFAYAINSKNSIIAQNINHFALYKLGTFDSDTGEVVGDQELICDAAALLRKEENV